MSSWGVPARWRVLFVAVLVQCSIGALYCVGIYLPYIQTMFGLPLGTLQAIATCGNVGETTCFWAGAVLDKWGPRATLLSASLVTGVSGLMLWAVVSGRVVSGDPAIALCVISYCFSSGESSCALHDVRATRYYLRPTTSINSFQKCQQLSATFAPAPGQACPLSTLRAWARA